MFTAASRFSLSFFCLQRRSVEFDKRRRFFPPSLVVAAAVVAFIDVACCCLKIEAAAIVRILQKDPISRVITKLIFRSPI